MFGRDLSEYGPIGFAIALTLALWAIFSIQNNKKEGPFCKAAWSVAVLVIPFFGFLAWLIFGPKAEKK